MKEHLDEKAPEPDQKYLGTKFQIDFTYQPEGVQDLDYVPKEATVKIHYIGRLIGGNQVFDNSVYRGKPFEFTLGKG